MEVCRERATPAPPPPEGEGEEGAEPAHARRMPRGTPTPLAGPRSSGRGGSPQTQHQVHPETPPASPVRLKGREEEEEEVPGRETPEVVSARGEVC